MLAPRFSSTVEKRKPHQGCSLHFQQASGPDRRKRGQAETWDHHSRSSISWAFPGVSPASPILPYGIFCNTADASRVHATDFFTHGSLGLGCPAPLPPGKFCQDPTPIISCHPSPFPWGWPTGLLLLCGQNTVIVLYTSVTVLSITQSNDLLSCTKKKSILSIDYKPLEQGWWASYTLFVPGAHYKFERTELTQLPSPPHQCLLCRTIWTEVWLAVKFYF